MGAGPYFREDWQGGGQWAPLTDHLRRTGHGLNNVRVDGNAAEIGPLGIDLTSGAASVEPFPWGQTANGYSIAGFAVTIRNIELQWGSQAFTLANTSVTIPASGVWYVGLSFDGAAITVPSPAADKNSLRPTASLYRCWLFGFQRGAVAAKRVAVGHVGVVEIDASWGPP